MQILSSSEKVRLNDVFEEFRDKPIDELVRRLIAAQDGVDYELVTDGYVRRERHGYFESLKGSNFVADQVRDKIVKLKILTREEMMRLRRRAKKILKRN